ncbi:hypothetical protein Goshw_027357 [Gossypium schwendimanii]|uniref:Uncharacterized protein n=1 Tax=Gossypium schwendimanii TaxID=34291 RepID=A0A7J9LRU8_GOSSC|nr:hypothetical protein [Gossypium schwendimanii]
MRESIEVHNVNFDLPKGTDKVCVFFTRAQDALSCLIYEEFNVAYT